MNKSSRSSGIDLFRCLLVYGICAYHAFFCCGPASGSEARLWTWAVPGFAFVSGYFGVSYTHQKLIRLMLTGCVCAVLPWILGGSYKEALFGYWYLYAYALLMILSPLINQGLEGLRLTCDYRPLWGVVVLAIWSWLSECFLTRQHLPRVAGMGALSFVSVFVAYVLGWTYRTFPSSAERLRDKGWLLLVFLPFMFVFGHYTSPFTLAFVIVLFALFEHLQLPCWAARLASVLASAGLSVYLLHTNRPVLGLMREAIDWSLARGVPRLIALCGVAFCVFLAGALVHVVAAGILSICWRRAAK